MALLRLQIPQMDAKSIDSEANILDKLKRCICEIITLYSQVYSQPTSLNVFSFYNFFFLSRDIYIYIFLYLILKLSEWRGLITAIRRRNNAFHDAHR